jgi:hypothetical protein
MTFDDDAAERVRLALGEQAEFTEKKMFGGVAFMVGDHMAVALGDGNALMVRVGKDGMDAALARGAEPMQMGGRTMNGFVVVSADRVADADLDAWISVGVGVATSLPPKGR